MASPSERQKREGELKRRKADRHMQVVVLRRNGVDVEAHVIRSPYQHDYAATWKDPITGQQIVGRATLQEVHEALERAVKS